MKGISTGQPEYDKRKAQKRWLDRERHNIHNDFSADLKPTPEQIEKKRKRDELNAKEKARLDKKAEKRRMGRPKGKSKKEGRKAKKKSLSDTAWFKKLVVSYDAGALGKMTEGKPDPTAHQFIRTTREISCENQLVISS